MRTIGDGHYSFLHRASRDIWRSIDESACIYLSGARYAEEGSGRGGRGDLTAKGKVREVFGGSVKMLRSCRETYTTSETGKAYA